MSQDSAGKARMRILTHPDPALRQRADEVAPAADPSLRDLAARMSEVMYAAPGVGLAATQLGVLKRVIVFDLDEGLVAVCNPVLTDVSEETVLEEEGCLSVPGIVVPVERAERVVCEGLDLDGSPVRIEAHDILARVLQHEVDHLNGVLIIDRASPEARREALREYNEARLRMG